MRKMFFAVVVILTYALFNVASSQEKQPSVAQGQDSFLCAQFTPAKGKLPSFLKAAVEEVRRKVKKGESPAEWDIPSNDHIVVLRTDEDWRQLEERIWHPTWGQRQPSLIKQVMDFHKTRDMFVVNHTWPVYVNGSADLFTKSDSYYAQGHSFPVYFWTAGLAHEVGAHIDPKRCGLPATPEQMLAEEIKGLEITVSVLKAYEKAGKLRGLTQDLSGRVIFVKDQEELLQLARDGKWEFGAPAVALTQVKQQPPAQVAIKEQ